MRWRTRKRMKRRNTLERISSFIKFDSCRLVKKGAMKTLAMSLRARLNQRVQWDTGMSQSLRDRGGLGERSLDCKVSCYSRMRGTCLQDRCIKAVQLRDKSSVSR